ncbi:MAG: hypothetical protein AB7I25_09220 [Vicinamibacterales bacterium]
MDSSPDPIQPALPLRLAVRADSAGLVLPRATIVEATRRLTGTPHGSDRVRSVLAYRETLALLGLTHGFQWMLVPPAAGPWRSATVPAHAAHVDVVTFCRRPLRALTDEAWLRFVDVNQPLLDPSRVWAGFGCRAYFVDLGLAPEVVVAQARFWFDVLNGQRAETGLELIEVPLGEADDAIAARMVTWS